MIATLLTYSKHDYVCLIVKHLLLVCKIIIYLLIYAIDMTFSWLVSVVGLMFVFR